MNFRDLSKVLAESIIEIQKVQILLRSLRENPLLVYDDQPKNHKSWLHKLENPQ